MGKWPEQTFLQTERTKGQEENAEVLEPAPHAGSAETSVPKVEQEVQGEQTLARHAQRGTATRHWWLCKLAQSL